jgi:hypothetical protein
MPGDSPGIFYWRLARVASTVALSVLKLICNQRLPKREAGNGMRRMNRCSTRFDPAQTLDLQFKTPPRRDWTRSRESELNDGLLALIAICNKCEQIHPGFFDTLIKEHARHAQSASLVGRARRIK